MCARKAAEKPDENVASACRLPSASLSEEVRPTASWAESGLSAELLEARLRCRAIDQAARRRV